MCTVFFTCPWGPKFLVCFVFFYQENVSQASELLKFFLLRPWKSSGAFHIRRLMFQNTSGKSVMKSSVENRIEIFHEMKGARTHTPPMNDAWTPRLTSIGTFHSFQPMFARPLLSIETSTLCCVVLLFQVFSTHNYVSHCFVLKRFLLHLHRPHVHKSSFTFFVKIWTIFGTLFKFRLAFCA